jgi:hypothetical protein
MGKGKTPRKYENDVYGLWAKNKPTNNLNRNLEEEIQFVGEWKLSQQDKMLPRED